MNGFLRTPCNIIFQHFVDTLYHYQDRKGNMFCSWGMANQAVHYNVECHIEDEEAVVDPF